MVKWSFSGLKDYDNCPKQYHEVKVLQNFVKTVTHHMQYGTEVHRALEEHVRDGAPLAENYKRFQNIVDALLAIPGERFVEYKMALRDDKTTPCAFDSPDYWVRGIVDLLVIDGATAYIIDYKTGSAKYPDPKQLKLMALFTFAHFPQVEFVKAGLVFVLHEVFVEEQYRRDEIGKLWLTFEPTLVRLKNSYDTDKWPARPSPLCGWCPVKDCDHYRPPRR